MKPVFIYALLDPLTLSIRYCGQTTTPDKRLREHLWNATRYVYHVAQWVQSLLRAGLKPIMEILDVVPDSEADFWERVYIQNFRDRGFSLTNISEGGSSPMRGRKHSPATLAIMSAHRHTEDTRQKMRDTHKANGLVGEKSPNFGRRNSAEAIEKTSAFNRGKTRSSVTKLRIREANLSSKLPGASSQYRGVLWRRDRARWLAWIRVDGKMIRLGIFRDELLAAKVRDEAARKYHGEAAKLNFDNPSARDTVERI